MTALNTAHALNTLRMERVQRINEQIQTATGQLDIELLEGNAAAASVTAEHLARLAADAAKLLACTCYQDAFRCLHHGLAATAV